MLLMKYASGIMSDKNIKIIVLGAITSLFSTVSFTVTVALQVMAITGSAMDLGITFLISTVPYIIFGIIAGIVCDRYNRKNIIIYSDGIKICMSVAFLLALQIVPDSGMIWLLYCVSFVLSTLEVFSVAAVNSIIPQVVPREKILDTNSIKNSLTRAFSVFAPALSVILFSFYGIEATVFILILCYMVSFIVERQLDYTFEPKEVNPQRGVFALFSSELHEGGRIYTQDARVISLSVNGFLTHFFMFPFLVIGLPFIIIKVLSGAKIEYGIVESITAIGIILSVFLIPKLRNLGTSKNLFIGMIGMFVGSSMFLALLLPEAQALFIENQLARLLFFSSACLIIFISFGFYGAFFSSFLHQNIPPHKLGKGMAFQMVIMSSGRALGLLVFGYLFTVSYELAIAVMVFGMFAKFIIHIPFVIAERNLQIVIKEAQ
ncbi:hypothetical protein A7985_14645 [Pseudoalteromonas luteoviolacea]|uniref:MFS transporter n=1 Tax=Pseudoalteromonas luteoviolacea TaxID=43657 RepID=A0A1C0TQ00_9GAMM|nr:MFS transporter [Pseudoalteromonas luteoviolacea]OCQ21019.1 hypothetical protein A7985_14645 [Pseudoalteromonas luteoviolacea]